MNCNPVTENDVVVAESGSHFVSRLEKMLREENERNGLIGFRLFPVASKDSSIEDIAEEVFELHDNFLAGNYTDVTEQVL